MNTQESKSEKSTDNPLTPYNVSVAKISPGIYAIGANPAEPDYPDDRDLKFPRVETLLARSVLANRIKEWGNKLIVKKLNPWKFFGIVDVKITKYDGQLIHYSGLEFKGSPQLAFWNFIEPFLKKGIDEWLDGIADLCLQRAKDPEPYLKTVRNSLHACINDVYFQMSDIDYRLRKGAAACRASENFGKDIQRKDVRDKTTLMINFLNDCYKEVLDTAQADLASTKPKETEQKIEPVEAPKQNAFRSRNAIRLKFTIWNKDDNYKLLLDIINDSTRDGIPVKNIRKLNTLKERLKKAGNTYNDENYKKFANSLKYKDGRIYTEMLPGMIIPEINAKK